MPGGGHLRFAVAVSERTDRETAWRQCSPRDVIRWPASESSDSEYRKKTLSEEEAVGKYVTDHLAGNVPFYFTLLYHAVTISFSSYSLSFACSH